MQTKSDKIFSGGIMPMMLLAVGLLGQFACSTNPMRDDRPLDMSKIYVFEMTPAPNLQLPAGHEDALIQLSQNVRQQLAHENKLQSDPRIHSLSFYGAILSYRDGVIDVQGELYDDEQFLVYSRVKRQLAVGEDWRIALNLIAEQLLDQLMVKLQQSLPANVPAPIPLPPSPAPDPWPLESCWGCWRHGADDSHGHHRKPEPHWLPGSIREVAPRGEILHQQHPHRRIEREESSSDSSSTSSSGNSIWFGGGSSSTSSTNDTTSTTSSPPSGRRSPVSEQAPSSRPSSREADSGGGRDDRGSSGSRDAGSRSGGSASDSGRGGSIGSAAPGSRSRR